MKHWYLVGLASALLVSGCDRAPSSSGSAGAEGKGRYSGIGIYEAGRLWSQVKVDPATPTAGRAGLADDEHVIVVVDSRSGEVRQCGDHSGICVAMNPWSGGKAITLPAQLNKTAVELDAEKESPIPENTQKAITGSR